MSHDYPNSLSTKPTQKWLLAPVYRYRASVSCVLSNDNEELLLKTVSTLSIECVVPFSSSLHHEHSRFVVCLLQFTSRCQARNLPDTSNSLIRDGLIFTQDLRLLLFLPKSMQGTTTLHDDMSLRSLIFRLSLWTFAICSLHGDTFQCFCFLTSETIKINIELNREYIALQSGIIDSPETTQTTDLLKILFRLSGLCTICSCKT